MVKHILSTYEMALGQAMNFKKFSILFFSNVSLVSEILDVVPLDHGKYLGLPSLISKSYKNFFSYLKDRDWKWISD